MAKKTSENEELHRRTTACAMSLMIAGLQSQTLNFYLKNNNNLETILRDPTEEHVSNLRLLIQPIAEAYNEALAALDEASIEKSGNSGEVA